MARPTRERFVRESPEPLWQVGSKIRCFNPGRFKALEENEVYTISWIDWPFCLEVEEIPDFTWDMRRFLPYTGEIVR